MFSFFGFILFLLAIYCFAGLCNFLSDIFNLKDRINERFNGSPTTSQFLVEALIQLAVSVAFWPIIIFLERRIND